MVRIIRRFLLKSNPGSIWLDQQGVLKWTAETYVLGFGFVSASGELAEETVEEIHKRVRQARTWRDEARK